MPTRQANAVWEGPLKSGQGQIHLPSGAWAGPYSFGTRFESVPGTNPEELLGAAHAACFSMALSFMLELAGHTPTRIASRADVTLDKVGDGFKITKIKLICEGRVPGIDQPTFLDFATKAKTGCPVSQALAATPIELDAKLL